MRLEDVLADAREEAATLARYGQRDAASAVGTVLDKLTAPLREYLTWHDEKGAALLSGKPMGYFQSRFRDWERRDLARCLKRGQREYREVVIPKVMDLSDVQADAERVAREDSAA
jgi:hypothetical protein